MVKSFVFINQFNGKWKWKYLYQFSYFGKKWTLIFEKFFFGVVPVVVVVVAVVVDVAVAVAAVIIQG